jgi:hypothetical protein
MREVSTKKKILFYEILSSIPLTLLYNQLVGSNFGSLKRQEKEVEELKESQKAMQKDLQQIKSILRGLGLLEEVPQNLFIDISGRPFKGDKNVKLTLMEFSEYQ